MSDQPTDTAEWLLERNAALAEEVEQIRAACKAQIDVADELSRAAMSAIATVVIENAALHRQLAEARAALQAGAPAKGEA